MKKIRILFQGDSLTDGDRDRSDIHNLGESYPKYAAFALQRKYPDVEFEFIDLGIGGDRTDTLLARADDDFVDIKPDVVSILVGINDVWNRYDTEIHNSDEVIAANYRTLLEKIKKGTAAKIMMIQPYTVGYAQARIRDELVSVHGVIKALADEFADAYMPIDDIFWGEGIDPATHTRDGVHLKAAGAEFMGERYAEYVSPLIDQLLK